MRYCPKCRDEFEDWVELCPDCRTALVEELPQIERKEGRDHFFKRHLNWTWLLGWFCFPNVAYLCGYLLGIPPTVCLIVALIAYYGVTLWVLNEKGRGLLWAIIPISALFLGNKRRPPIQGTT